ncbi:HAD family hydrolase [Salmonella enterica]|nr:HAD family hydrolase [Salmonella enterica]
MDKLPVSAQTNLVIFDLFGTLIKYGERHHPFRQVLKWARENGRCPEPDDARRLMTVDGKLTELVAALGISAPDWLLEQAQLQIQEELASLTLYDDVAPTLVALTARNIPFAICSNLASPYGSVLERLLISHQFIRCMSYEVGFIKPDPEIYRTVTATAQVDPAECLFVGDTLLADVEGPRQYGMRALHLLRGQPSDGDAVNSLIDILPLIN